jgi:hypothetical protein
MSSEIKTVNGVTLVNPNKEGTTVVHEDLMTYVRLIARTKSRSIISKTEDKIELEAVLKNVPENTNYTYPVGAKYQTTDWTDIGGNKLMGTDVGGFGITSIDIDVKSSFQPQVVINFVDIRGATLFEQGPCSPYAAFFHMPYPVFELTVKGFYGRPVTYTLALRKFNAKFNASTGNFEVQGEFIGYTYAFLADLLMGYALAAPNMPGGEQKFAGIWEKIITRQTGKNPLPQDPITLKKMIVDINELEKNLGELSNTDEFQVLSKLNLLKTESNKLDDVVTQFMLKVDEANIGVERKTSGIAEYGNKLLKLTKKDGNEENVTKFKNLVKTYFGDNGRTTSSYETLLGVINNIPTREENGIPKLSNVYNVIVQKGLYVKDESPKTENNETYYFIDLGYFTKQTSEFRIEVDKVIKTQEEKTVNLINGAVEGTLKYVPTIENVMTILIANMELFLHLLLEASWNAEEQHKTQRLLPKDNKLDSDGVGGTTVYPWPLFYDYNEEKGGDVEKYPGEEPKFSEWFEVKFVEDYLKAYLTLVEELNIVLGGDVAGKPGFDNYIPLTPFESPIFDSIKGVKPIAYWKDNQEEEIYKNIGERAFLLGDYTLLNGLTAWKARYQLTGSVVGNSTPPSLSTIFTNTRKNSSSATWWDRITDFNLMEKYGKIDGVNAVNSIVDTVMLLGIKNQIETDKNGFKQKVIDTLTNTNNFKSQKFSEFISTDPTGISSSNAKTLLKNIDSTVFNSLTDDTEIYTYSGDILIGESGLNTNIAVSPNPHNNTNFLILEDSQQGFSTTRKITIEENLQTEISSKSSPFSAKGWSDDSNGFRRTLSDKVKTMLSISEDTSFFKLDESTRIPIVREELKDNFLRFDPWADDSGFNDTINYSIGGVDATTGSLNPTIHGINFGMPWSPNNIDNGTTEVYDALIQTPLWAKNLPSTKKYRRAHNWFKSEDNKGGTYYETSQQGLHSNADTSYKALAYLALITLGWSDEYDEGFGAWYDFHNYESGPTEGPNHSIMPFFRVTGGQAKVPKGFALVTGAVLWRMKESGYLTLGDTTGEIGIQPTGGSASDPIYWWTTSNVTTTSDIKGGTAPTGSGLSNSVTSTNTPSLKGFKKLEPYHWPHVIGDKYQTKSFCFISNSTSEKWSGNNRTSPANDPGYTYMDIRGKMRNLLLLPVEVKQKFIDLFERWALGTWKTKYIISFDPLHFGSSSNIFDGYGISSESGGNTKRLGPKNGLGKDEKSNQTLQDMYNEMYNSFVTLVYSTPKAFSAIYKNDFRNEFNIRKIEMDKFLDGWIEGFSNTVDAKLDAQAEGQDSDELTGKNALNDPDIKLNLYRSFKSLFDKWISRSNKSDSKFELFYNNISNISDKDRTLIDHFQFVNRGFSPIGDKSVVDITYLKSIADNPTSSLYMVISELLQKNGFDFFPLPNFVPYGKDEKSQRALKDMFEPVTNLDDVENSPSFICMYIGGSSKSLSMGRQAQSFCGSNNEILYQYEDDSISNILNTDAKNISEGNVTAFLVDFGIENQSHFKSITLNQAEFKETNESLQVIDQLAKGGNENNRVAKGQNLYNVYQTRSYTCEVETLGNLQIQPMMYFQLEHVPMFHGSYLITEVKHSVKPHNVYTTFKGTRIPKISIPLVTDAFSTMVLGQTDASKTGGGSGSDFVRSLGGNPNGYSSGLGTAPVGGGETIDISSLSTNYDQTVYGDNQKEVCPTHPRISDGGVGEAYIKGQKYLIRLCKVKDTKNGSGKVNVTMALMLAKMMDKAEADGVPLTIGSSFRTMDSQISTAQSNKCFRSGEFRKKGQPLGCTIATARPGWSNHQSGTAIDFGCNGKTICYSQDSAWCAKYGSTERPNQYPCFKWMVENAEKFNYHNYKVEAWHWSRTGG